MCCPLPLGRLPGCRTWASSRQPWPSALGWPIEMHGQRKDREAMIEIAIDVGGTFTDVVCLHDQQRLLLVKVPTTPDDLVQGVRQGVARVLELAGQPTTAVERFIHSTTIATNAILEQKGAITGV